MTLDCLIIELQKLQHKGLGKKKISVWNTDAGVSMNIHEIKEAVYVDAVDIDVSENPVPV